MVPVLFKVGPFTLHSYGLLVAVGFLVGLAVLRRSIARSGVSPSNVDSLAMMLLLSGLVGARVLYFAVDGFSGLAGDPLVFFRIWEGGLVFYGGVAGALIAATWYARRHRIRLLALTDSLVPPLLIAHAFGRLGCLAAGCCYGRPSGSWPGIVFRNPDSLAPTNISLVPTQPLEAAVLFIIFVVAFKMIRQGTAVGRVTVFYLCAYGIARFLLEFLRGDDRGTVVAGLAPSQWIAIVMVAAGTVLLCSNHQSPSTKSQ